MLFEKLAGFDIGLWDRNILTSESKNLIDSTTGIVKRKLVNLFLKYMFHVSCFNLYKIINIMSPKTH